MKNLISILILLSSVSTANAQVSSRNALDLGITSNANLTKDNPTSDSYVRVTSANSLRGVGEKFRLRLGYVDYFQENANDLFSLRASDSHDVSGWNATGALFANVYTTSSPGTTDNAFTNYGGEVKGDRDLGWGSATLSYGGGYRLRYFPSFDGRNDHTFFALATYDRELNSKLSLGALAEFGILFSSLSEYGRVILDLGGSADYQLNSGWSLTGDLTISQSFFTNRNVTTQTAVGRSRGIGSTGTRTSAETYSSVSLGAEGMKKETENFEWGFATSTTSQSSASGSLDYSVLDVMAKLLLVF